MPDLTCLRPLTPIKPLRFWKLVRTSTSFLLTYKYPGPWTASNSLTRYGDDGPRSKSSRLPGTSIFGQTIYPKVDAFYRSRTVRRKSSGRFGIWLAINDHAESEGFRRR